MGKHSIDQYAGMTQQIEPATRRQAGLFASLEGGTVVRYAQGGVLPSALHEATRQSGEQAIAVLREENHALRLALEHANDAIELLLSSLETARHERDMARAE